MLSNRFISHLRMFARSLLLGGFLATSASADQFTYIVKRGDTLSGIAQKYGLSVTALAERNGLSRNYLVMTGQRLVIVPKPSENTASSSADTIYVVKRGDTLFGLAEANQLSVEELARRNGLDKNFQLKIGDQLILPGETETASKTTAQDTFASLPSSISRAIRNADVTPGRWKYIVVHHSGVDEGTVKGMDRYHRDVRHMENGLAYHFVIGNGHGMGDGEIAVGNRWKEQLDGGHLRSLEQDKIAIGICLVGNFDKAPPTAAEMKSLNALVRALMERCHIPASNVKTHQQINIIGTRCPGSNFPTKSFLAGLKE